tara:strand:+ start:6545 stop:6961 length:417 start_codon:yes stop_codon:yes gene_type:complete
LFDFVASTVQHIDCMGESRPNICEDTRGITALDEDNVPQAVCVFDGWSPNSCVIHIWINNPFVLKHGFAEEVFNFVFSEESGRTKIIGITPSDNLKALRFIKHIGFKEIFRISDGCEVGVDFVVTEINKDKCRYYNNG